MYFMYLRKSRKDEELVNQNNEETLKRHERTLFELAHRMGITVDKVYREVVSGDTIAARPMMQELLNDIEDGLCDGVLVMEIERLARGNTRDQGLVAEAFKYSRTKIITPMRIFDPDDEADEEFFEFNLFMSRREYKTITRRMQAGRKASFREGKYTGNIPPYGYDREKLEREKGWILVPNPSEKDIVRLIFDLYVHGEPQADGTIKQMGTQNIAIKLNALGIPTRKGGKWTVATLRDLLQNPVYVGKLRMGWRKSQKKLLDGRVVRQRPKATDYLMSDGRHDAIIDNDIFDKAQEIFAKRGHPIPNKSLLNPLAGIVICGKCGHVMQRRPYDKRPIDTLLCHTIGCDNISSDLQNVEQAILVALKQWMQAYSLDVLALDCKDINTKVDTLVSSINGMHKDIDGLNRQLSNVYDLLEQGIYDTDTFMTRSKHLKEQIIDLKYKIEIQEDELDQEKKIHDAHETIIPKVQTLLDTYEYLPDAQAKNDALRSVLDKVLYTKSSRRLRKTDEDTFEITIYPKVPPIK